MKFSTDPFDEVERRMEEYMEHVLRTIPTFDCWQEEETFSPLTDVAEENDKIIVTTDLPGVDKENIELSVKDNFLIIKAAKKQEDKTEKEDYLRKERSFMRYYRKIPLPEDVNEEGATAQLKNGVLTITLPKVKSSSGKKIKID